MSNKKSGYTIFDIPLGLALIIATLIVCVTVESHKRWEKTITPEMEEKIKLYQAYEKLGPDIQAALEKPPLYGKKFFSVLVQPSKNQIVDAFLKAGAELSSKEDADYILTQKLKDDEYCSTTITDKNGATVKIIDQDFNDPDGETQSLIEGLAVQNRTKLIMKTEAKPNKEETNLENNRANTRTHLQGVPVHSELP